MEIELCTGNIEGIDANTLDMAAPREDGHRFLRGTIYDDGGYDAVCLKCGLHVHFTREGEVDETW